MYVGFVSENLATNISTLHHSVRPGLGCNIEVGMSNCKHQLVFNHSVHNVHSE